VQDSEGDFAQVKRGVLHTNRGAEHLLDAQTLVLRRQQEKRRASCKRQDEAEAPLRQPIVLRFFACFVTQSKRSLQRFNEQLSDDMAAADVQEHTCIRYGPPDVRQPRLKLCAK
jgi:hypothetical protein